MRNRILLSGVILLTFLVSISTNGQENIVLSQYIHNQYAINPAFGGSRNTFTVFGAYKMQWSGVEEAPSKQLFTLHSPLKNDHMALGVKLSNSTFSVLNYTNAMVSYTYRVNVSSKSHFALGIEGGVALNASNWSQVNSIDTSDPLFAENTSSTSPAAGVGLAYYNNKYYISLSAPSLFYYNQDEEAKGEFAPDKINYLFSGGYLFRPFESIALQPSGLVIFNPSEELIWDAGLTTIYNDIVWGTLAYRSLGQVVIGFAVQPLPTLRIGYSFDYGIGDLASFGGGSHEISIQYDFGHKIRSSNPKFF